MTKWKLVQVNTTGDIINASTDQTNDEWIVDLIARVIDDRNDFDWDACVEDARAILDALKGL